MLYQINITSKDSLGFNLLENVVAMANLGATLKPGTMPIMNFPHHCTMILEADNPPTPSASIRVFELDTHKEIFAVFVEDTQAATFSMDTEANVEAPVVDKSTNSGVPFTVDQLNAMDWKTEFKEVCKSAGISGRDRAQMTKEYLAKYE